MGSSPHSASALLLGLKRILPYYRSSFYAKGRVVKDWSPPPSSATMMIHLSPQWSLGCPFCFASATRARGAHVSLSELEPVLRELEGIEKVVLIGGEPFEHPELLAILDTLWRVVTSEVEVFTNGTAIPEDPRAAASLAWRLTGSGRGRLRLTLGTDAWHRFMLGDVAFERKVRTLFELERVQGVSRSCSMSRTRGSRPMTTWT